MQAHLKRRANSLCGNFADIAKQEEQLVMQVPELEGYQVFSFKQN